MISRQELTLKIKNTFPNLLKPEDYTNIIFEGIRLNALDEDSSKRRRDFQNTKTHSFSASHKKLGLTEKIEHGVEQRAPTSARQYVQFDYEKAQTILNEEKGLLLDHIADDDEVKNICVKTLKLNSSVLIQNKLNEGKMFDQAGTYEKLYNALQDQKIKPTGYMWFGIRFVWIPTYYLSEKAKTLIET